LTIAKFISGFLRIVLTGFVSVEAWALEL